MQVNSLKEAILISLEKFGYTLNDRKIVKKIILSALDGTAKNITRNNGAQQYVLSQGKEEIIKELSKYSNSKEIDEIIDDYINNAFRKKEIKADLKRVEKIIKSLNLNVENDEELMDKTWNYFLDVYENKNENFSKQELKNDIVVAALKQSKINRGNVEILSTPELTDEDLTVNDSLVLVDKYIYDGKEDELMTAIDKNPYLFGNLLKNLLNYVYFEKQNNIGTNKLDSYFNKLNLNIKQKIDVLKRMINSDYSYVRDYNIELMDINKNEILIELIKNSIYLNIYSSSNNGIDNEEGRLYTGEENVENSVVKKIIDENNRFLYPYLEKGFEQDIDEIYNNIININDKDIKFLCNIYIRSRCDLKNRKVINEIKGKKNDPKKIYVIGILEDEKLISKLNSPINKVF